MFSNYYRVTAQNIAKKTDVLASSINYIAQMLATHSTVIISLRMKVTLMKAVRRTFQMMTNRFLMK